MYLPMKKIFFLLSFLLLLAREGICEVRHPAFPSIPSIQGVNLLTGQIEETLNASEIRYEKYQEGWNQLAQDSLFLSKDDLRIGKVKTIHVRLSEYSSIYTHLLYEPGKTTVYEGSERMIIYQYKYPHYLLKVEYYQKNTSGSFYLSRCERLYWEESNSSPRLISRLIENEKGQGELCYCFFYNERGQLIKEMMMGNLSGNCSIPCKIGEDGYPQMEGLESYSTVYTYSEEDPKLLVAQIEDNGMITTYQYDDPSKQCTAIFRGYQNGWISRCFYFYDKQGFLEWAIQDDGHGQLPADLTGVTQRQMIHLEVGHQFPLLGKPLKIESYYWEPSLSTASEELLYEILFNYDQNGQLISTVDSQGEVAFKVESLNPQIPQTQQSFLDPHHFQETVSLSEIWNGIVDSFYSAFQYLQMSSHQTKMKWNAELKFPAPVAQAFERIGKTLLGESTYLLMGPHFEETHVDIYGQHEVSDKVRVTFINGILNTRRMMLQSLDLISESHGGVKIHYVFRPTEGWTWDISRAVMIKTAFSLTGFRSLHAHLLAKMWRELIQEIGGVNGGGVIIHYAHSLGGAETDRARELLTPEEQKMIRVTTFGSSTLIRNVGYQSVINIVSVNDGVSSFFLEPLGHIRNYFDPDCNVRFYGTRFQSPYWPTDHLLSGPSYSKILCEYGQKFLEEFTPRIEEVY